MLLRSSLYECTIVHMQCILPTLFQIPKHYILLNFDARPLPFYLLETPPYYYNYISVQLCCMSLDPIATPSCRESTKVFPGNFLDEVPSYAQQQLDGPSTKSVRKDLDHVVNKIPWTKDGIIIIPSWKYATILYFNFYILTK